MCATLLETSGFGCSWPPTITKAQSRVEVPIQELDYNLPGPQAVA